MPWDDEVVEGLNLDDFGYSAPPPREAAPEELTGYGKPVTDMAIGWDDEIDQSKALPAPVMAEEGFGDAWGSGSRFGQLFTEGAKDVAKSVIGGFEMGTQMAGAGTPETGMPEGYDPNQQNFLSQKIGEMKNIPSLQPPSDFKPPEGIWEGFIYTLPQVAGQVAAGAIGGPVASSLLMFGQIAGGSYNEMKKSGVSEPRAVAAAMANALAQTPMEQFSLDKILKVWKGTKPVLQKVKEYLVGAGTEGLTEFLQKYPEEIAHIWAKNPDTSAGQLAKAVWDAIPQWTAEGIQSDLPIGVMMGLLFGSPGLIKAAHFQDIEDQKNGKFNLNLPGAEGGAPTDTTGGAPTVGIEELHRALGAANIITPEEQATLDQQNEVMKNLRLAVEDDNARREEEAEKVLQAKEKERLESRTGYKPERGGKVVETEPIPDEVKDQIRVVLQKAPFLRNREEVNLLRKYKIDTAYQEKKTAGPRQEKPVVVKSTTKKEPVFRAGMSADQVGNETIVNDTDMGGVIDKIISGSDVEIREELESIRKKHGRKDGLQELLNSAKVRGRVRDKLVLRGMPEEEAKAKAKEISARFDKIYQEVNKQPEQGTSAPSVKTPVLAAMSGKPYPTREAALREASVNSAKKRHPEFKNSEWDAVEVEGGWGLVPKETAKAAEKKPKKKLVHKPKEHKNIVVMEEEEALKKAKGEGWKTSTAAMSSISNPPAPSDTLFIAKVGNQYIRFSREKAPATAPRIAPKTVEEAAANVEAAGKAVAKAKARGASEEDVEALGKEWSRALKEAHDLGWTEEETPSEPTLVRGKTVPESTKGETKVSKEAPKKKLEVGARVSTEEGQGTIVQKEGEESYRVKMDKDGDILPYSEDELGSLELEAPHLPPVTKQPFMFKGMKQHPSPDAKPKRNPAEGYTMAEILRMKQHTLDEALDKMRITGEEHAVMKAVLDRFPDAWRRYFHFGFSFHEVRAPKEALAQHGVQIEGEYEVGARGMAMDKKINGEIHTFIVMFNKGDLGTFFHEMGHYFERRILTGNDLDAAFKAFQQAVLDGRTKKRFTEWFADTFAQVMTQKVMIGDFNLDTRTQNNLARLFRRMLAAIRDVFESLKNSGHGGKLPLQDLINDIWEKGREVRKKTGDKPLPTAAEINALHSSPHMFDKFKMEKVGTGEGAQSFGWGLYFTDTKSIADYYKKQFSRYKIDGEDTNNLGNKPYDMYTIMKEEGINSDELNRFYMTKGYEKYLLREIANRIKGYGPDWKDSISRDMFQRGDSRRQEHAAELWELANKLEKSGRLVIEEGKTYKVTLHKGKDVSEYDYMSWDKPVTQDHIDKILAQAEREGIPLVEDTKAAKEFMDWLKKADEHAFKNWETLPGYMRDVFSKAYTTSTGKTIRSGLISLVDGQKVLGGKLRIKYGKTKAGVVTRKYSLENEDGKLSRLTEEDALRLQAQSLNGNQLYKNISSSFGSDKEASLLMLRSGIDGIKYPGGLITGVQNSEATNYVVFDENAITIEEVQYDIDTAAEVGSIDEKSAVKLPERDQKYGKGVGKYMVDALYVHRDYTENIPPEVMKLAENLPSGFADKWNILKWNPKTGAATFIHSPDFNTSPEPVIGDAWMVKKDGTAKQTITMSGKYAENPWIYHHKWQMVGDDFSGFNVEESKQRSQEWMGLDDVDKTKIGKKAYWDAVITPQLTPSEVAEVARPMFTEAQKKVAMGTSRTSGSVGPRAIIPRIVRAIATKGMKILDFGAGRDAAHAEALRKEGHNVNAYDFHIPGSEQHLDSKYDLVYASNVLNVQPDIDSLRKTIGQLASVVHPDGKILVNWFPGKPNYVGYNALQMQGELSKVFKVTRVPGDVTGDYNGVVWELKPKINSALLQRFDSKLVKHVGLQEAVEKGLISKDDAAVIDGIMEVFPDTWRDHFEPRFSEQEFAPNKAQMEAHGLKDKDLPGKVVKGALLQEKIGPLKQDAKHLAVIFKHGDVTTFLHEFGEFAYKRLTTKDQRSLVEKEYKAAKERGETRASESEWFSDRFRDWWMEQIESGKLRVKGRTLPKKITQLFRRVLTAIKNVYDRIKANGGYTGLDSLFNDIVTTGGHLREKYFWTDAQVVIDYVIGTEPTKKQMSDQGFSGYAPEKGNNAKTWVSWDPGTMCPKQEAFVKWILDKYINVPGGPSIDMLASPQIIARMYDEALLDGVDVPCSYCYVEGARRKALAIHEEGGSKGAVGFSMAKKIVKSVPYRDWILKRTDEEIAEFNKRGGLRLFSFSDYIRSAHRADVDLLLRHAKQRGLSVKAITKNPHFVEDFGDTGIVIDMSIDNLGYGTPWQTVSDFKTKYPNNVFARCVATTFDEYVMWANLSFGPHKLFVDVITPYHGVKGVPLEEGYEELAWNSEGGKKIRKYINDHPELRLAERTCCLMGGKCFSNKHDKQCPTNCGALSGNLHIPEFEEMLIDDTPAQIGDVPQEIREKIGRTEKSSVVKVREALTRFTENWQTRMFDKLNPIKGVDQVAYMLHRLGTGVQGILETFLSDGKLRWDKDAKVMKVDTVNEGFLPWIKNLGVDGEKLLYWTIARRAERLEREGREKWIDNETRQKIDEWVGRTASDGRTWDELHKELQAWNNSILDLAEATGLVDPEARAHFAQEFYVPFYRLFEDENTREEFLRGPQGNKRYITDGIRRLKGAEAKLGDPLENLIRNWTHLINESVRNVARGETYKVAKDLQSQLTDADGNPINLVEEVGVKDTLTFRKFGKGRTVIATPKGDTNILSFNDKGKRVYFRVNDAELFNALYGLDQDFTNPLFKAMGLAKRMLTRGATFGPMFRAANMFRDSLHTAIISKDFMPLLESMKGFMQVMRRDKNYVDLMATGGGFGSSYVKSENPHALSDYVEKVVKRQGEGAKGVLLDTPRKILEFWELIGEASENAARVALFSKRRKQVGDLQAAFEAKDLLDFTMSGNSGVVQFIIRTVPFANARMQGLYKLGRAAAADPVSFAIKGGLLALASIALWAAYKDDDRYKELEDWDKWSSYHFWVGDKHVRVPMPFEVGALFGSLFQTAASVATGTEDLAFFGKWAKQTLFDTLAFNPIPQVIRPAVEQYYNKVTFTGRPIENERLQGLITGERAYPWTSDTLKVLGRQFGLPPARAEALIRGYLATIGTFCLGASDIVVRQFADLPPKPTRRVDEYPLIGGFLKEAGPARHTRYGTAFYDIFNEVDQIAKTIKEFQATGRYEEARELRQENRKLLAYKGRLTTTKRKISSLNKLIDKVNNSPTMEPEEKQRRIDALLERKNRLTKRVYDEYKERVE